MRKIKLWCDTHPDEHRPEALIRSLLRMPIEDVSPGIVNVRARVEGSRIAQNDKNMSNAYPGNSLSSSYAEQRATQVLAASQGFFAVGDVHEINGNGEDTVWIGKKGVSRQLLGFIGTMGIRQLVLTEIGNLHEQVVNGFLLETSGRSRRSSVPYLRNAFDYLAHVPELPVEKADAFEWYVLLNSIKTDRITPDDLPMGIRGFDRLPDELAARLGYDDNTPVHMVAWGSQPNAAGYWAEICTPTAAPDDTLWPQ